MRKLFLILAIGLVGCGTSDDNDATPLSYTQLSAGGNHSCALSEAGAVYCWGLNDVGQVGSVGVGGTVGDPHLVALDDATISISAGWAHSCATLNDGRVFCWGANDMSQLGDNSTTTSPSPVQVTGLSNATEVSAGGGHSCAMKGDGTVWCWGLNDGGQLGNDNYEINSQVPVQVQGIVTAVQISVNTWHSCALLASGTAQCWGTNWDGELGNQEEDDSPVPVDVMGLSDILQIVAGDEHSCAVLENGKVYCWGANSGQQLGPNGG
ncbi:hypothetical protein KAI87_07525, partial [Myxococcota bacterium]|nr:hypothetical protein [Myxococcota bacterium]